MNVFADYGMKMMQFLAEIAEEEYPFQRFDEAARHTMVEHGVVIERPILAALAAARAQVTVTRPNRLKPEKLVAAAEVQREQVRLWINRKK